MNTFAKKLISHLVTKSLAHDSSAAVQIDREASFFFQSWGFDGKLNRTTGQGEG